MEYFRKIEYDHTKPWLILGKGPSFKKYFKLEGEFNIFGLNHVAELVKCDITHFIDEDVISLKIIKNSKNILCPWHLHQNSNVKFKTLQYNIDNDPIFGGCQNKIYWYNCSTWKNYPNGSIAEIVKVKYFSAEIAFQILGLLGEKKVYSLGIDGGNKYAEKFSKMGLIPFKNRRNGFDDQFKMIEDTLNQFNMVWERL